MGLLSTTWLNEYFSAHVSLFGMNQTMQKTSLCAFVCLLAAGCHSSTVPAPAASTPQPAAPVAQPAPVAAAPAPAKKLVCTGKANDEPMEADIETGALYVLMTSKLGGWTSCTKKKLSKTDDQAVITFAGGATLTVSEYPSSDAAEQQAALPAGTAIMRADVIKALQQDQPPDGCGVDWSKLGAGGPNATGDFKVSGTTCTLDVHVKMLNGSVVGFGFSVAA